MHCEQLPLRCCYNGQHKINYRTVFQLAFSICETITPNVHLNVIHARVYDDAMCRFNVFAYRIEASKFMDNAVHVFRISAHSDTFRFNCPFIGERAAA